jgi:hypothetical protein
LATRSSSFFPRGDADDGHDGREAAVTDLNLEPLRKQAKERVRVRRAAGEQAGSPTLSSSLRASTAFRTGRS